MTQAKLSFEDRLDDWRAEHHARATHPSTSHEAAAHMKQHAGGAMDQAYAALLKHSPCTAAELEQAEGVRDGQYRKRLADLRTVGRAVVVGKDRCKVTGRTAQLWKPVL